MEGESAKIRIKIGRIEIEYEGKMRWTPIVRQPEPLFKV